MCCVSDPGQSFSLLHPWVKSADTDFITLPDATSSETAEDVRLGVGVGGGPNLGLPQPQWRVPEQFGRQNEDMADHTNGPQSLPQEVDPSLRKLPLIEVSLPLELFKTAQ